MVAWTYVADPRARMASGETLTALDAPAAQRATAKNFLPRKFLKRASPKRSRRLWHAPRNRNLATPPSYYKETVNARITTLSG